MDFASPQRAVECLIVRLKKDNVEERLLKAAEALVTVPPSEAEDSIAVLLGSDRWDCLSVGLQTACLALEPCVDGAVPEGLRSLVVEAIGTHLEHEEPRVRKLIAQALCGLCRTQCGLDIFVHFRTQLLASVKRHIDRREQDTMTTRYRGSEEIALDDVTGWKSLETSLLALVAAVDGCGDVLAREGHVDHAWIELTVQQAGDHCNRYVREGAMGMARVLSERCPTLLSQTDVVAVLSAAIAKGLRDAWPQVVYAASRAVRSLLLAYPDRQSLFPLLLPRLCLNRYFVPEGVQVYSQTTWEEVFGPTAGGRAAVAEHIAETVGVYVEASADDKSHFARIAACYAMAELVAKVDHETVRPWVDGLLAAVVQCLTDPHWEVRSAGCIALRALATSYISSISPHAPSLLPLCFRALEDESWAIRADAAQALAAIAKGMGSRVVEQLVTRVRETLESARLQPPQTREEAARLFNDPKAHTGKPIIGCCGATEKKPCSHHRKAQPWVVSDGAVWLLSELMHEELRTAGMVDEFLPRLADIATLQHFPQADQLRETVWSVLPSIFRSLGKRAAKQHLELFQPQLTETLASPSASQLARHASAQCLHAIAELIGPSILLNRLPARYHDVYLSACGNSAQRPAGQGEESAAVAAFPELRNRPSLVSI